jgi:sugar phosphate isomerase/epimerase
MVELGVSLSPKKSEFGPLLFSGNLMKGIEIVKNLGYTGVELSLLDSNEIDQDSLIEKLEVLSLKVYAIATGQTYYTDGYSLYSEEEHKRQKTVERLQGHIDFAAKLGSMVIIGGIRGTITAQGEERKRQEEKGTLALKSCVDYAEDNGVILLLEPVNRYETTVINSVDEGLELIEKLGSMHLKLLPDTFHMNIEERSMEDSIIRAGSHLGYIHFADSNRLAPGWGHIDFPQVLASLEKIGYNGPIGIEVLPKPDDYQAAEQAIRYMKVMTTVTS